MGFIVFWWIWPLLWIEPTRTPPRPEVEQCFAWRELVSDTGQIAYRLYRPAVVDESERLPLLIWLHGRGEAGENNRDQLAWLELVLGRRQGHIADHRCFILALQCSHSQPTWVGLRPGQPDPLQQLEQALQETIRREPIDTRRLYLSGVSSGGTGCWEFARRHPHRFAAVVPFASSTADPRVVTALVQTPVWAFQSTADGPAAWQATATLVQRLRKAGGRAHLTRVQSPSHDCWTAGFRRYRVWDWMLSQRRGSRLNWPPGVMPSRFAIVLAVLMAGTGAWGCGRRGLRRWRQATKCDDS